MYHRAKAPEDEAKEEREGCFATCLKRTPMADAETEPLLPPDDDDKNKEKREGCFTTCLKRTPIIGDTLTYFDPYAVPFSTGAARTEPQVAVRILKWRAAALRLTLLFTIGATVLATMGVHSETNTQTPLEEAAASDAQLAADYDACNATCTANAAPQQADAATTYCTLQCFSRSKNMHNSSCIVDGLKADPSLSATEVRQTVLIACSAANSEEIRMADRYGYFLLYEGICQMSVRIAVFAILAVALHKWNHYTVSRNAVLWAFVINAFGPCMIASLPWFQMLGFNAISQRTDLQLRYRVEIAGHIAGSIASIVAQILPALLVSTIFFKGLVPESSLWGALLSEAARRTARPRPARPHTHSPLAVPCAPRGLRLGVASRAGKARGRERPEAGRGRRHPLLGERGVPLRTVRVRGGITTLCAPCARPVQSWCPGSTSSSASPHMQSST
eukprot:334166-Prymnesium_polylepis.1